MLFSPLYRWPKWVSNKPYKLPQTKTGANNLHDSKCMPLALLRVLHIGIDRICIQTMEFKTAGIKCYEWNQKDSAVDVEGGWDLLGFMVEGAFELGIKRQVWFW